MIDYYDFGRISIKGKSYSNDLIIFSDRIRDDWRRKEGHRLDIEDLQEVLEVAPEVLVVGTGYSGLMTVPSETRRYIESKGIELEIHKTTEACKTFNTLAKSRKVVAVLHLTC